VQLHKYCQNSHIAENKASGITVMIKAFEMIDKHYDDPLLDKN